MTYTEQKGYKPFNWNEFLNKKDITNDEWYDARKLSRYWITCACGTQCSIIPRNEKYNGRPMDTKLRKLGHEFCSAIYTKNKELAKEILAKIEKRSAKLIAEINLDISNK